MHSSLTHPIDIDSTHSLFDVSHSYTRMYSGGEYYDCAAMGECCDRTGGSLHYLRGDMSQRDHAHRLAEGNDGLG